MSAGERNEQSPFRRRLAGGCLRGDGGVSGGAKPGVRSKTGLRAGSLPPIFCTQMRLLRYSNSGISSSSQTDQTLFRSHRGVSVKGGANFASS